MKHTQQVFIKTKNQFENSSTKRTATRASCFVCYVYKSLRAEKLQVLFFSQLMDK